MAFSSSRSQMSSMDIEPYYHPPAYRQNDVICPGSDDEQSQEEIARKRRRYEVEARRIAAGLLPVLQSTILRGPLSTASWTWKNPWEGKQLLQAEVDDEVEETRYEERADERSQVDVVMYEDELEPETGRQVQLQAAGYEEQTTHISAISEDEEWWKPGSEEMLFTRQKVLERAAKHGMGHLQPREALLWCKNTAAEEAIRQESVGGEILMSVEKSDTDMEEDLLAEASQDQELPSSFLVEPNSSRYFKSQMPEVDEVPTVEQKTATKAKKRPIDSQWLKGSHVSKRARWEDGPVSTPTPLPGAVVERVRRTAPPVFHPKPAPWTPTNILIPGQPMNREPPRMSKLGREQSLATDGSSLIYQKSSSRLPNGPDSVVEDLGLSTDSQYSAQRSKSRVANQHRHQIKGHSNERPSDVELDDLIANNSRSINTPLTTNKEDRLQMSKLSTKLPKLPSFVEEISFVSEEVPSSRNVEKFKFRKKKRRSTETQAAPLQNDTGDEPSELSNDSGACEDHTTTDRSHHGELHEPVDAPAFEARHSSPHSHKLSESSWDMMEDTLTAPADTPTRRRTLSERESSTDLPSHSVTDVLRSSPPLPTVPRLSSPKLSPRSPFQPLSRSKGAAPKPPHSSSSSVRGSLKRDFLAGLLPKFEWENDRSAMDKIQMSLSQNYPSSSSSNRPFHVAQNVETYEDVNEVAAHTASEHVQGKTHDESVQDLVQNTIKASPEDRQEDRGSYSEDTDEGFTVISVPHDPQSRSFQAARGFPSTRSISSSSVSQSNTPLKLARLDPRPQESHQEHTFEGLKPDLSVSDASSASKDFNPAQSLSEVVASARSQSRRASKPMSSINQNDLSTQSFNTTPSGSRKILLSSQYARSQPSTGPKAELETNDEENYSVLEDDESSDREMELELKIGLGNGEHRIASPDIRTPKLDRSRGSTVDLAEKPPQNLDSTSIEAEASSVIPEPDLAAETPVLVSESSWKGCGPQSPWAAEPSQRLPPSITVAPINSSLAINDNEEPVLINQQDTPRETSIDSNGREKRLLATPLNNLAQSFLGVKTSASIHKSRRKQSKDIQTSSQHVLGTVTKNPWMSCLKNKSSGKDRSCKRVSFSFLSSDQGDSSQSQQTSGSPPPPEQEDHNDDDTHDKDSPTAKNFGKHFLAARRFTQILPDHVHSQNVNSSPALGAQAEAFIAADREISAEQEPEQEQCEDSPSRFLQPRSNASDNVIWGNHNHERGEQSPFQQEPDQEAPLYAPDDALANFDMDAALGEIGDFLTADWSVEDEMQKIKEVTGTREQEDTGYRRRKLFGLA